MFRKLTFLTVILGFNLTSLSAVAQSSEMSSEQTVSVESVALKPTIVDQNYCINTLAEFPTDDHEIRYQFFRLTEEIARDTTPDLRRAMAKYGSQDASFEKPMLEAIEDIANPVLRQAAPDLTIANMSYVIDFAKICDPMIQGQISSLKAYDNALSDVEFNAVIVEDALFLRQVLSDSLLRLGADEDPLYSATVNQYADTLITTRDAVEFSSFEAELDDLEALYMTDLDGRLKRSNDIINEEMDREVLGDSVALSDSMIRAEKKKAKERQLYTLIRILGGGG